MMMTMEGFFFPREDVTEDDEDDDDGVDAQAHTKDDDDVDGNASFLECNHMCQNAVQTTDGEGTPFAKKLSRSYMYT